MPRLILDSNEQPSPRRFSSKSHNRHSHLHSLLGGGKVADILLWRKKRYSAAVLAGVTLIWFLFEVVEYHFLVLLCYLFMTTMLVVFVWSNAAPLFDRQPPKIPEYVSSKRTFEEAALVFHAKFNRLMSKLNDIACGRDLKSFVMAIASLWIISVIGSNCSMLSLLYFVFLCLHTLPALYERYEGEFDQIATRGSRDLKKIYKSLIQKFSTRFHVAQSRRESSNEKKNPQIRQITQISIPQENSVISASVN